MHTTWKLVLSCYRCGGEAFMFKNDECDQALTLPQGHSYLNQEDVRHQKCQCQACGLEDHLENLVIKFV